MAVMRITVLITVVAEETKEIQTSFDVIADNVFL
jgi:hypothetical protein